MKFFPTSFIRFCITLFIFTFLIHSFTPSVVAQKKEPAFVPEIAVFVRDGCTHCRDAEEFLSDFTKEKRNINVRYYRLEKESERQIWDDFTKKNGISKVTPIIVVGEKYLVGFADSATTGEEIKRLVDVSGKLKTKTDLDSKKLSPASEQTETCDDTGATPCVAPEKSVAVSLPFIGKLNSNQYPLIILSAMLGFFDGFNPCAMWVLITFLIILMQIGDRRKMLIFVGTFVIAEAVMYSLILTVWFKTWDFVKLDSVVTPIVGILSIVGGIFFLREWHKKELECKVTDLKTRSQTRQKIKDLAASKFTIVTFLSILGIAFSVNIIEFACSIGIPQAFTKILELNELTFLQTIGYIGIYILFYMIDDFIVFGIALWGFDKLALTTKYSKMSNLFGGVVMIILGLALIFYPQLLRF